MAIRSRAGGDLVSDPKADREGFRAEAFISRSERLLPRQFHGANQGRGALELLKRQQPQRVAHDDGQAATAVIASPLALHASDRHRKGGDTEIGLGLATAGREPE